MGSRYGMATMGSGQMVWLNVAGPVQTLPTVGNVSPLECIDVRKCDPSVRPHNLDGLSLA